MEAASRIAPEDSNNLVILQATEQFGTVNACMQGAKDDFLGINDTMERTPGPEAVCGGNYAALSTHRRRKASRKSAHR